MSELVYSDNFLRGILQRVKTIAMVGASSNWNRPSYFVMKYLQGKGYRVIPVNPGTAGQMLLGEKVSAAQALEWGMINRCVPDADLMPTALKLAHTLADGPASLGLSRQMMAQSLDSGWAEQLHRERVGQRVAGKSEDFREGVTAFLQKRPAVFKGR